MTITVPMQIVTTHAIVGTRGAVDQWFLRNEIHSDMLRVGERSEVKDGVRYTDRFVAHDEESFTPEQAARYDEIVYL